MFELYLKHGRSDPHEKLDDWGFEGPRLAGVIGVHQTYGNAINVFFKDRQHMLMAKSRTRWDEWDENALTMNWCGDLVYCCEGAVESYYGDWGIITTESKDEP